MNKIRIFCTVGPRSLDSGTLLRLSQRNVDLLRINLSHTPLDRVADAIAFIQDSVDVPICLDTEGAQVRNGSMESGIRVADRDHVLLTAEPIVGTAESFSLTPPTVFETLKANDLVFVDFDGVVLEVVSVGRGQASAVVINGGSIGSNKAVTVDPPPLLPPLSEKDQAAVRIGVEMGVANFALSFANRPSDVLALRQLIGPDARIIAKIESISGVSNLDGILEVTDEILIDRGDLSREVPLESISFLQKTIIKKAALAGVPVAVATNLLESMLVNRKPTRAEINDIVNTLIDGASGLVLAAETAIGSHPVAAVDMLRGLIERFTRSLEGQRMEDLFQRESLVLPRYHGAMGAPTGVAKWADHGFVDELAVLEVDERTALDISQIGNRVYSPLDGFMTKDELDSVLDDYKLPSGIAWTMPIILQGSTERFGSINVGQTIRLADPERATTIALMHVTDKYRLDQDRIGRQWYGTNETTHPGIRQFLASGEWALGGPIEVVDGAIERIPYALTPEQTRKIFEIKGWSKVVGFHTRNVPHRGHEYLIAHAIDRASADGILLHPVMGPKRRGDFRPEIILGAYEVLANMAFQNALLASFRTYSRFAGPREAVFTALCRKNFGCSHFVVGRDHAGTGGIYGPNENRELFERLGDIGISPVFFDTVSHSLSVDGPVELAESALTDEVPISGTEIRDLLIEQTEIPEWLMRPEISSYLSGRRASGEPLFED